MTAVMGNAAEAARIIPAIPQSQPSLNPIHPGSDNLYKILEFRELGFRLFMKLKRKTKSKYL